MDKPAMIDYPINEFIQGRWSPRAFSEQTISKEDLHVLLEAARWAPSCYNDQPWHFIVATREEREEFDRMLNCLMPGNKVWAEKAAVLMLAVARKTFARNGKPNRYHKYDTGQAVAAITIQAVELGIRTHQMAGFNADRARETYEIPEGYVPLTAIALGYSGDPEELTEDLRQTELGERKRKPQSEFVFKGEWEGEF
jgi:nitroreductase